MSARGPWLVSQRWDVIAQHLEHRTLAVESNHSRRLEDGYTVNLLAEMDDPLPRAAAGAPRVDGDQEETHHHCDRHGWTAK